jgi:hypothetical protein
VLTGEAAVTIGAIGEGMVAGDMVNTASRLQAAAPSGAVLVGEVTMRAAQQAIAFEAIGDQQFKGKAAPVAAWRALRVVAERGGRGRSDALEAPFVGRDDELALLKDLYHATARDRRVRLVSVTGQGGIGKSRLAWEFLKYIDGLVETVYWHEGRSPSYGSGITFWALGVMVRERARLAEGDDEATTRARIAETVAQWLPDERERRWVEAALLALLGVGDAPPGGQDQLFPAWRTFFERIAAAAPVVMVFEDLHGPTAGCWRSSTISPNGVEASRSTSSWRSPARSSSKRDPTGAPASATSPAWRSIPSRPTPCVSFWRGSCLGCPTMPRPASSRAPTGCRCTRSRSCACSWPRDRSS